MINVCETCQKAAGGLLTVRFYGDSTGFPYESISDIEACEVCADKDIWADAVTNAAVALSKLMGKVIAYGPETSRAAKEKYVLSRGFQFDWRPRIYIGLTPFDDERAQAALKAKALRAKNEHVEQGRTLH